MSEASARGRASGWSRRDHGKQSKLNLKLLDILFVRLLYVARGDAIDAAGYRERKPSILASNKACPAVIGANFVASLRRHASSKRILTKKKKKKREKEKKTSDTSRLRNPSRLSRNVDREGEIDYSLGNAT